MHPDSNPSPSQQFLELALLTSDLIPAAVELDQCCFDGLWSQDGYERELDSPNSDLLILRPYPKEVSSIQNPKSKIQNPLIGLGCLWAILEEAHITILAIHPDYQGQGLGQALLCALMKMAWQRKLEWVTLEVRVSNERAIALYRKFGFKDVGRRRKYYQDTGEDALILWNNSLKNLEFDQTLQSWEQTTRDRLVTSGWYVIPHPHLTQQIHP